MLRPMYLLALLLLPHLPLSAQPSATTPKPDANKPKNLVINSSFEQRTDTSLALDKTNLIDRAQGWSSPNGGAPLLYTSFKKGDKTVIYDPFGASWDFSARTGKNVAGVHVVNKREYIQGTLREPLTVGKKYYFAFWVHYHCEGANNLGITFLPEKIKLDSAGLLPFRPATFQANVNIYDKKNTWALVRDSFIAYKPYQYFVIGNFFPDSLTKVQSKKYNHYFAYVDDILVIEAENQTQVKPVDIKKETEKWVSNITVATQVNTAIVLKNVYFKYDSAILQDEAIPSLDDLAEQMRASPTLHIRVKGHTSSEGADDYNERLSAARARSVRQYLIKKGIAADRIEAQGYGETRPLTDNDTEEHMALNRRVEFEIVAK
jgi:outer membrane protein OmpA-like peptidoglycan-associated protein